MSMPTEATERSRRRMGLSVAGVIGLAILARYVTPWWFALLVLPGMIAFLVNAFDAGIVAGAHEMARQYRHRDR